MLKKTAVSSLAAAALLIAHNATAHDSIKDVLTEGAAGYTAVVIGHGCSNEANVYSNIKAQSVVFPTGDAAVSRTVIDTPAAGSTPAVTHEVSVGTLSQFLVAGKFDGAVSLVPDRNVFNKQAYKLNAAGQVIGFTSTDGDLYTNETGTAKFRAVIPFYVASQSFVKTSCAKSLKIKIAVADACDINKGLVNTWVPSAAQLGVSSYQIADYGLDGVGSAVTLTINRDLVKNPLPTSGCDVEGGFDANVWPSVQDLNTYLPQGLI